MEIVYLSMGSNLGDRMKHLQTAISGLKTLGTIGSISSVYESASWGYDSKNNYLNCCVELSTTLSPQELLKETQNIEAQMGRIRTNEYTDREIDIDILLYGDLILNSDLLTLPHPHIEKRTFVLLPLNEIAPTFYHAKYFLTITQLLENHVSFESIEYYGSLTTSNIN
jgi:2-amino-4-hydroxy-6-hydroxymethyldihydropteridine diphosphokinase